MKLKLKIAALICCVGSAFAQNDYDTRPKYIDYIYNHNYQYCEKTDAAFKIEINEALRTYRMVPIERIKTSYGAITVFEYFNNKGNLENQATMTSLEACLYYRDLIMKGKK